MIACSDMALVLASGKPLWLQAEGHYGHYGCPKVNT